MPREPEAAPNDSSGLPNDFDARLRAAQRRGAPRPAVAAAGGAASMALRAATELVAPLVVGVAIGYGLDRWLDTAPWFLVGFFALGAATGVVNTWRTASGWGGAVGNAPADDSGGRDAGG